MDQQPTKPHQTAVYWDFENIHLSVTSLLNHEHKPYKPVDPVVRIDLIMDYVAGFGSVAVNRAYGNWQYFGKYSTNILRHSIQTVQLFPAGRNGKNGADIRMAIDIIDDLQRFPTIGTVVIVSGDVDFVPVAQRVRQAGLDVIGIGTGSASNKFWINACSEFKQYSLLLPKAPDAGADAELRIAESENPANLLVTAVANVQRARGSEWVGLVDIRPAMLRLDPSFDQAAYGEVKFINFVRRFPQLVEIRTDSATLPLVRLLDGALEAASSMTEAEGTRAVGAAEILEANFRPFDIAHLQGAAERVATLAQEGAEFAEPSAVKDALRDAVPANQIDGYYDLLRRTQCVVKEGSDRFYVPRALGALDLVRKQVLAGLLGYLDEATPEPMTEEEFVETLGGDETLLEEVARLPALAELPVSITGFGKVSKGKAPGTGGQGSIPRRLTSQRGIFVPSPEQLEETCQMLAAAAQGGDVYAGEVEITRALAALPTISDAEAPRLYKNVYTAHCFERANPGWRVHPNLLRPEAVRHQILGRLLAYLDFLHGSPVDRADFARLFADTPEWIAEAESLPGETDLPVPIRRA